MWRKGKEREPVDDVGAVELFDSEEDLGCVEAYLMFKKVAVRGVLEEGEERTTTDIIEDKVEFVWCLEGVMQLDDEG